MRFANLAVFLLAACVPETGPDVNHMLPSDHCSAEKVQHLVSQPYDASDFDPKFQPLRVLPPGSMMTMDHRPERLNVELDKEGTITRIWCG